MNKPDLEQSNKVMNGRIDDCKMIFVESLDLGDGEIERNPKLAKSKVKEVKLFDEFKPWSVKIRKNLLANFK